MTTVPAWESNQSTVKDKPPDHWRKKISMLLYIFLGLITVAIVLFATLRPILVLPRIRLAPGYVLTNPKGESVTSEAFRGRLTFYTFTYSGCDDAAVCPQSSADIQRLLDHLDTLSTGTIDVGVVTILLDDHPKIEGDQLKIHPRSITWQALPGDQLQKKFVVGHGFQVYFNEAVLSGAESDGIPFTPRITLVDGNGLIRAEYRGSTPDLDVVTRDIELLVQEAENSGTLSRIGYEAAHLFVCYP